MRRKNSHKIVLSAKELDAEFFAKGPLTKCKNTYVPAIMSTYKISMIITFGAVFNSSDEKHTLYYPQ